MKFSTRNLIIVGVLVIMGGVIAAAVIQSNRQQAAPSQIAAEPDPLTGPAEGSTGMPPGMGNQSPTDVSDEEIPVAIDAEYEKGVAPVTSQDLPDQINGLSLSKVTDGEAAVQAISELHGTEIVVSDGLIAKYGEKGNGLDLWFSTSNSVDEATELLTAMIEQMKDHEIFSTPMPMPIRKRIYYQTMGQDLMHFFYQRGPQVVWITLDLPDDQLMPTMQEIVGL